MLELADRLGCHQLATGHYARIAEADHHDGPLLRAAADAAKDQTYMLAALSPASLARMRFPLGELTKPEVREIAARGGPAGREQGRLAGSVLPRRHEPRPGSWPATAASTTAAGDLVDADGNVVGRHDGQHRFTVGQRRGIGVAAGEPLYVLDKDAVRNEVTVGPRSALRTTRVAVRNARLHRAGARVDRVKLRYRSRPIECRARGRPRARPARRTRASSSRSPSTAPRRVSSPA